MLQRVQYYDEFLPFVHMEQAKFPRLMLFHVYNALVQKYVHLYGIPQGNINFFVRVVGEGLLFRLEETIR